MEDRDLASPAPCGFAGKFTFGEDVNGGMMNQSTRKKILSFAFLLTGLGPVSKSFGAESSGAYAPNPDAKPHETRSAPKVVSLPWPG